MILYNEVKIKETWYEYFDKDGKVLNKTVYVDTNGVAWDSEHLARFSSCSHKKCEEHDIIYEKYQQCPQCLKKHQRDRWKNFPAIEWDGKMPITLLDDEVWFYEKADIEQYCQDNNFKAEDLLLIGSEIKKAYELDPTDIYQDELFEGEVPSELDEIFEEMNKKISEANITLSYWADDVRVIIK